MYARTVTYEEMIDRLNAEVGSELSILVWTNERKEDVIASLTGTFERGDSEAAQAASRAQIADKLERQSLPPDLAEELVQNFDELADAHRHRQETGEWPNEFRGAVIAVGESGPGAGRREHFMLVCGGQRASDLYLDEKDF